MTRTEFLKLIAEFEKRKNTAIALRDKLIHTPETSIAFQVQRNYLQGGIDTLCTIIESLQKRYEELTTKAT